MAPAVKPPFRANFGGRQRRQAIVLFCIDIDHVTRWRQRHAAVRDGGARKRKYDSVVSGGRVVGIGNASDSRSR